MKNKKYTIGLIIIIVLFGVFTVKNLIRRVEDKTVVDDDRHLIGKETHVEMFTFGKAPGFSFTDQNGKTITNKEYEGKVYLLEFFFTTCPTICPVMNRNMAKIRDEFITKENFGIASITIDPEHDTPEVLKKYAETHGATSENWHFLTGEKSVIYDLAESFNMYVGETEDGSNGGFSHSGLFALIDKKGNIVSRLDQYGNPIKYYDGLDDDQIKALMVDIGIELRK